MVNRTAAGKTDAREARGAETQRRIIESVWSVMAEKGLPALTVRLVAQQAGISHAMVHYHFTTKDDLILAVVEHARHYWIDPMEQIVRSSGTPAEKLEAVIVWMAEPATREVMRVHRQLLSQSEWNERLRRAMAAEYARWRATYIELFRELKDVGSLDKDADPDLVGAGFATLADHLVGKRALDPTLDTEAIMREMLRPFLR
ncbi:MAG TPA: TetR/AcrR family transcriptional regulator [Streptosporangiaceae bacterium]|nr:TetR/AcrR family transcriptional regulator [Streptosporangiaceae bacterium]